MGACPGALLTNGIGPTGGAHHERTRSVDCDSGAFAWHNVFAQLAQHWGIDAREALRDAQAQ